MTETIDQLQEYCYKYKSHILGMYSKSDDKNIVITTHFFFLYVSDFIINLKNKCYA